ncbi:hypothetical protein V3C99_000040 [Haemonchus contortus]
MTDSHSSATANGQTDRAEETTEKVVGSEGESSKPPPSPRLPRSVSASPEPRRKSSSRRTSISSRSGTPQPLRRMSVMGSSNDVFNVTHKVSQVGPPQPLRKMSVVGATYDITGNTHTVSQQRKRSTASNGTSSPTKAEPPDTIPPKASPRSSQSSTGLPAALHLSKGESQTTSSPRATPRTSNSSSSSPPADSPNRPGKYTSIDLENDLPEIYRTQLNPDLEDPDMSEFFSRPPPFFKNAPPVYYSRKASPSSTIQSHGRKPGKFHFPDKETRMRICLGLFVFAFFIIPIMMIFLFRVIPAFTE